MQITLGIMHGRSCARAPSRDETRSQVDLSAPDSELTTLQTIFNFFHSDSIQCFQPHTAPPAVRRPSQALDTILFSNVTDRRRTADDERGTKKHLSHFVHTAATPDLNAISANNATTHTNAGLSPRVAFSDTP